MGRDPNEVAKKLRRPREKNTGTGQADWMGATAEHIQLVIAMASKKQCALRFGYSRDGGAYAIGVYAGGEYWTDYVRPTEDIDGYLQDLTASLQEYSGDNEASLEPIRGKKR